MWNRPASDSGGERSSEQLGSIYISVETSWQAVPAETAGGRKVCPPPCARPPGGTGTPGCHRRPGRTPSPSSCVLLPTLVQPPPLPPDDQLIRGRGLLLLLPTAESYLSPWSYSSVTTTCHVSKQCGGIHVLLIPLFEV